MSGYFITGTDTGCGKTETSLGLMAALQTLGLRVQGMKPVASGCDPGPDGLRNQDAWRLLRQASTKVQYEQVNPYAFEMPIAPHIAAAESGVRIDLRVIEQAYRTLAVESDRVIVEGVGGWRVPLGAELFVSDLPACLGLPVILVVGVKLGCLNHAALTADRIRADGCTLAGWVANLIDPEMLAREANLDTLTRLIEAPCLGHVHWLADPSPCAVGALLDVQHL
ncbi:MAG: dethiobiotin synthase [Sphingobacteriia bacterium]|nr:dethiobiotin synthase [Sphingobacteriia bacterium]NCC37931.1 dethiobiotin synthase [Gammaproteobacteria bacterium]